MTNSCDFEKLLAKAKEFHGHVCPGIVLGTRLTMAGLRELGMDLFAPGRDLIVYVEVDRCATDAIQAITGCSLGRRNLKHKDFGKFAATFVNSGTGNAVRVVVNEKNREINEKLAPPEIVRVLSEAPEEDILKIERVRIVIPKDDLPGHLKGRVKCSACGERIADNRQVVREGVVLCRNCAGESYYTVIEGNQR
jgi:formylmethanofuran dehydrogenase subunit E